MTVIPQTYPLWLVLDGAGPHRVIAWLIRKSPEPYCEGIGPVLPGRKWSTYESYGDAQAAIGTPQQPGACTHQHHVSIPWHLQRGVTCEQLFAIVERLAETEHEIRAVLNSLPTPKDRVGITDSVTAVITKENAS